MYTTDQLMSGVSRPRRGLIEVISSIRRAFGTDSGVDVMNRDWDNLVILDACRYDVFEDLNTLGGSLSSIQSVASQTGEFVRKTFGGKRFPDTVYVLAKPNPSNVDARLHEVVNLWKSDWGSTLQAVPNEVMVEQSLEISERYPNKRLIVHFNPPHLPFIGESGRRLHKKTVTTSGNYGT